MEEYWWNYHHVPSFGNWDYIIGNDDLPYTQCFESARHQNSSLVRYGSYNNSRNENVNEDTDLYVAGDLYQNDVVTPTLIVVPRRHRRVRKGEVKAYRNVKGGNKKEEKQEWSEYSYNVKAFPSPIISPTKLSHYNKPKPIDQDLYKVPPNYFHLKPTRKRGFGIFSSCLFTTCV